MRRRSTMACGTDVAVVTDDIAGGIYTYSVRVINFNLNILVQDKWKIKMNKVQLCSTT